MQSFTKKIIVSLVFMGCMCLPDQADALFGWGRKKRELNSEKEVASSSRTSKNMRQRFTSAIQKKFHPCWAPACTDQAAIARCAEAAGLILSEYLKSDDNFFITTGPDKKNVYVKVRLRDINMAAWKAVFLQFKIAQKQFEAIIKKQGDISGLILESRPGNEDDQTQIQDEQIKLQEMQQHYIEFLAQSGLLDIDKFMAEQESLQQTMDVTGGSVSIPIIPPKEPIATADKFARIFYEEVRLINRAVAVAMKEFLINQGECFKRFCETDYLAEKRSYIKEEVQDLGEKSSAKITQSMVDSARADYQIIQSRECSGPSANASMKRVFGSFCREVIKGKEIIPACQVAEEEWGVQETAKTGGIF